MSVRNLMQKDVSENESSGEEYEVDEILEMRVLEDGTEEFKVRWKNYGSSDDSWEPKENLGGAKTALNKFLKAKNPVKKTSKTSGTPSKGRKRKAGGNGQDAEDGANIRSSSGSESDDDDFSVSSASKKKKPSNMRSEHDPTPANLSSGMNGSVSKLGSKESSTSVEYVSRKSSSKLKAQVARSLMGTTSKRTEQTPKTSKAKEAPLQFDGIYFNSKGLQIVVQGTQDKNNARRVLTFEEAKDEDAIGLCDYLRGMVKFTEEGKARISVPHNMETDERDGKESRMRDDGKLNFDE